MDGSSIATYEAHRQLFVSPNDIWTDPLGPLIRQALTADLQSLLGISNLLPPRCIPPNSRLRILTLTIRQLMPRWRTARSC